MITLLTFLSLEFAVPLLFVLTLYTVCKVEQFKEYRAHVKRQNESV